jgi:hypothetical protein
MPVKAQRGLGCPEICTASEWCAHAGDAMYFTAADPSRRFPYCSLDLAPIAGMPRFCANAILATSCT